MIGGFILGGVTCVNTPTSLYNSADRQWMMAKLEALKRLNGSDMPLIERKFFSRSVDCTKVTLEFPLVMKSELHHNGNGIIKIETERDWLELLNFSNQSNFTIEPFIEALYDIRVQKIGDHYRAFKRTSLSGSWKISCGQVVLEEIPLPDRYKKWLVECSRVFDEMDICALQLLTNSDGKEFVIDAYDSTMPLLGDTQEEDRKLIADVIVDKLKQQCLNSKRATNGSSGKILKNVKSTSRDQVEDSEDTMRNLRKTFAGIFGDM
ncbi:hypothetical protein HELRODRAFT_103005 [Helobdella robusta]|uniref:Synapsin ATP-binding domain-containing protein n=1 Tax=Helobdella robusta TaxID=6412 RepID=T1EDD6_HELRO|nr:hypothetical protein HELRODRAFT_103005 [Helobdella robusta]ESN94056.1 hypothetical protein HELRODRAFT_103005 [Helobdella robusta]